MYIDPGAGAMGVQILIAGILATLLTFKRNLWKILQNIRNFFKLGA